MGPPASNGQTQIDSNERERMRKYWNVFKPTIESMMLDHNAIYMMENEQNEILSSLPNFEGKRVLELGSGIGRFTTELAKLASHVSTVDFMEAYVEKNKENNQEFNNIKYFCADVMLLDFPKESFDIVFSNWLLMYLTEKEVSSLMKNIMRWLKPGGHFFMRESCYHQSGNVPRPENPTKYRTPLQYITALRGTSLEKYQMTVKSVKNIVTPLQYYGNATQVAMMAQKMTYTANHDYDASSKSNLSCSKIAMEVQRFGSNSTQIDDKKFLNILAKKCGSFLRHLPGSRVIMLNCLVGNNTCQIAEQFGCIVQGVDLYPENIHKAIEAQEKVEMPLRKKFHYEACDWRDTDVDFHSNDAILCFDFLLSKEQVFNIIKKAKLWLKSDGGLIVSTLMVNGNTKQNKSDDTFISRRELIEELTSSNLKLDEIEYNNDLGLELLRSFEDTLQSLTERSPSSLPGVLRTLEEVRQRVKLLEKDDIKFATFASRKVQKQL